MISFRFVLAERKMRNVRFSCLAFSIILNVGGCRAHSPSWNGTWELNASKSSFQGQNITISIATNGEYRYDDGASSTTFRCDGKFRPAGNNRTQSCVKGSATTLDKIRMENGVKTNTTHWELSSDGKVLTLTTIAFRPTGPVIIGKLIASRISGSNDFAGQWQDTTFLQRHSGLTLRLDSQYLHIGSPHAGVDAPLSGTEVLPHGSNAILGMTYAVRKAGERDILIVAKLNGIDVRHELLKLSDDGKVITDYWLNPSRPTDTATLIYEKNNDHY